ncbi:hypothetical protein GCM10027084_24270 [Pseudoxanthomonas sangjuensis]|nr:RNA methyltransferase [Pseudoxanthomonas sangjuensis]
MLGVPSWLKQRSRELRSQMTDAERRLWDILRERQIRGFKFRRQQPLGNYIVDFICLEARLVLEVDGGQHGDEADHRRDAWLRGQGFVVLRFCNHDVLSNTDGVYQTIEAELKKHQGPPASERSPWGARERTSAHPHPNPSPVKGEGLKGRGEGQKNELRLYGFNAVRAVFERRPQAIRKLWLAESRIGDLKPLLAWCVKNRIGYRVVEETDLDRLAASSHHEGVVADVLRVEPAPLSSWLRGLPDGPALAIWLDGVGNPHNFGAILRSAAHFGVAAILLPENSTLALSGAAARVAEGGAESVPLVRLPASREAMAQLRGADFALAATVVRGGSDLFAQRLPQRLVYVMGAEGDGMDANLAAQCDLRLSIPGTGAVESLNVAAATAVFLAQWRR